MPRVVRFIAYSDYLCPWCWNASLRLGRLAEEFEGRIEIIWRSYLLRPIAKPGRDREKFRQYTESWLRPDAEEDGGDFRVWASDSPPPTHSIPAHRVAKAAARLSASAFRVMHGQLMWAYFNENRDISNDAVLRELWLSQGLPEAEFETRRDPAIEEEIRRDHDEARAWGATGVPAIRRVDNDAAIVGAHPEALYRRWIERSLARGEGLVELGSPLT